MEFLEDYYGCLHVCGCGVCCCLALCVVCVFFFFLRAGFFCVCAVVWCDVLCLYGFLRCCVQGCVSSDLFGVVAVCVCVCVVV